MFNFLKNLIAELSFFKLRRETMKDIHINPLLEWWYENDYDNRLMDVFFKMPPNLATLVDDEEVLVAMDLIEKIRGRMYDKEALSKGEIKLSKFLQTSHYLLPFSILMIVISFGFGLSITGIDATFLGLGYFYCLIGFITPLGWVYRKMNAMKIGIRNIWPGLLKGLALGLPLWFLLMWAMNNVAPKLTVVPEYIYILVMLVLILPVTIYLGFCFAIRYVKQQIHLRRMET